MAPPWKGGWVQALASSNLALSAFARRSLGVGVLRTFTPRLQHASADAVRYNIKGYYSSILLCFFGVMSESSKAARFYL